MYSATITVPSKSLYLPYQVIRNVNVITEKLTSKKEDSIQKLKISHTLFQLGKIRALILQLLVFLLLQTNSHRKHINVKKNIWFHFLSAILQTNASFLTILYKCICTQNKLTAESITAFKMLESSLQVCGPSG